MKLKIHSDNLTRLGTWHRILLVFLIGFAFQIQARPPVTLEPEAQHPTVAKMIVELFKKIHYEKYALDDTISLRHYNSYLKLLDFSKSFFLKADIERFKRYRYQLDDHIKSGNLDFPYFVYNTFVSRVDDRVTYVERTLARQFDFSVNENFIPDRETLDWAGSEAELDEIWRTRLKYEALSLKLADKDWDSIASTLKKRYQNFQKRIKEYSSEDVFQIYINSFTEAFDPHSGYMSPFNSENFNIQMRLSFEGIGAQLASEDDYTKVMEIIPGGPADLSKQLKANDKIIAVGQDEQGEMVDVIGMRLDDVVQKIRGKKGTVVRLEIIPADAPPGSPTKTIRLLRDKIVLKEREPKSSIVELVEQGSKYKLGIVTIPSFYADKPQYPSNPGSRSTSNDVRRLIQELNATGIDGLIIDLRGNTGGFLQEAVALTGLFIDQGPVVQVRRSNGVVEVEKDLDATLDYEGPLAVLVDRVSASASEIFAAAIQDYGRGIVLGGQTFGKGTVQTLMQLNNYLPAYPDKLGEVRLTMAKFYRVAGGSTQHTGVLPDINFPSLMSEYEMGESKEPNALRWDEIKPATFHKLDYVSPYLAQLRLLSLARIQKNTEFQYILQDIQKYRKEKEEKAISLNEKIRKKETEDREALNLVRVNQRRQQKGLKPLLKGEKADPAEKIDVDPWLDESQLVLANFIELWKKNLQAEKIKKNNP